MKVTKPQNDTRRKIGYYDRDTGEIIDDCDTLALLPKRIKNGFGKGWMAMGQDAALEIAKCRKELGGEGLAVFLYLVSHLDYNNSLMVPQAQIGEALGMKKQHVSRAMRKMAAMGVIIEGKKIGTMKTYRLSADYGWKGKAADHKKVLSHGFRILEEDKR